MELDAQKSLKNSFCSKLPIFSIVTPIYYSINSKIKIYLIMCPYGDLLGGSSVSRKPTVGFDRVILLPYSSLLGIKTIPTYGFLFIKKAAMFEVS